jgi:hypothetical protein
MRQIELWRYVSWLLDAAALYTVMLTQGVDPLLDDLTSGMSKIEPGPS